MNSNPFKRHRFPPSIILLAVRWYCRYPLSYRDVRDLLAERGVHVDQIGCNNRIESDQAPLKRITDPGKGCRVASGE